MRNRQKHKKETLENSAVRKRENITLFKICHAYLINGWERKVHVTPSVDLYSGQIIVKNMSDTFQIVYLCDLKPFIMGIAASYQQFGNHKQRSLSLLFAVYCCDYSWKIICFVLCVAKLIISTVCRVADMLYSMS